MESGSTTGFCLEDFTSGWEGVQQFEDPAYLDLVRLVTPSSPALVEQTEPSCNLLDLENLLGTAELMPYGSSLEEEIFLDTLNDMEFMDFLMNSQFASEANENDLCPSQKKKVSDCQPTHNQDKAGSSCVPRFITNDNLLINDSSLNHFGTFNRKELHTCSAHPTFAINNAASRKRKLDEGQPYIKKPPNAFMLFRALQRQNVADELHITGSAKINVELGYRWKMMSEQEQAPYFEQAHRERRAHEAKYPGWSPKDNFGKKAKRRKADNIRVPQNHHHFAFPEAPANQQPVMTWPYATAPKSFPNQALNNQDHSYHTYHSQNNQKPFQELPVKTLMINGIAVQATPLEAYLNQARENQAPIEVLPLESFTTPGSAFQDLTNQAPKNQTTNDLAPNKQAPTQELPEERTIMINGIPAQTTPLESFMNQACENQELIKVLPLESFTTPGSAFQNLTNQAPKNQTTNDLGPNNQAPPFNLYEVFLNMAPEDQVSIMRLLDQPAT